VEVNGSLALGITTSDLDFARTRIASIGLGPTITDPNALATLTALGFPPTVALTNQIPVVASIVGGRLTYFGLVGEGGIRLGLYASEHIRLIASYGIMYWNNVRRAQEMFTLSPVLRPRAIDFTTHMIGLGVEVRY
jgi:hypothetical protein